MANSSLNLSLNSSTASTRVVWDKMNSDSASLNGTTNGTTMLVSTTGQGSRERQSSSAFFNDMTLFFPVTKEIKSLDDIKIEDIAIPPTYTEPQFDMVLIYAEKDQNLALLFRDILERFVELQDKRNVKVCVIDRTEHLTFITSKFRHIEEAVKRSTYMFLFMSKNFVSDSWAELQGDECLQESIENPTRRWCVIPIHTVPKRDCNYTTPFGLRSLKGIHIDKIFADAKKTFNADLRIEDIKAQDLDQFFVRSMQNLFNARLREKIAREDKQKTDRDKWIRKERLRRFNDAQERQKQEQLEEAETERMRQLILEKTQGDVQRGRAEIANKPLEDLPVPSTEPLPDFVPANELGYEPRRRDVVVNVNLNCNHPGSDVDLETSSDSSSSVSIHRQNHDEPVAVRLQPHQQQTRPAAGHSAAAHTAARANSRPHTSLHSSTSQPCSNSSSTPPVIYPPGSRVATEGTDDTGPVQSEDDSLQVEENERMGNTPRKMPTRRDVAEISAQPRSTSIRSDITTDDVPAAGQATLTPGTWTSKHFTENRRSNRNRTTDLDSLSETKVKELDDTDTRADDRQREHVTNKRDRDQTTPKTELDARRREPTEESIASTGSGSSFDYNSESIRTIVDEPAAFARHQQSQQRETHKSSSDSVSPATQRPAGVATDLRNPSLNHMYSGAGAHGMSMMHPQMSPYPCVPLSSYHAINVAGHAPPQQPITNGANSRPDPMPVNAHMSPEAMAAARQWQERQQSVMNSMHHSHSASAVNSQPPPHAMMSASPFGSRGHSADDLRGGGGGGGSGGPMMQPPYMYPASASDPTLNPMHMMSPGMQHFHNPWMYNNYMTWYMMQGQPHMMQGQPHMHPMFSHYSPGYPPMGNGNQQHPQLHANTSNESRRPSDSDRSGPRRPSDSDRSGSQHPSDSNRTQCERPNGAGASLRSDYNDSATLTQQKSSIGRIVARQFGENSTSPYNGKSRSHEVSGDGKSTRAASSGDNKSSGASSSRNYKSTRAASSGDHKSSGATSSGDRKSSRATAADSVSSLSLAQSLYMDSSAECRPPSVNPDADTTLPTGSGSTLATSRSARSGYIASASSSSHQPMTSASSRGETMTLESSMSNYSIDINRMSIGGGSLSNCVSDVGADGAASMANPSVTSASYVTCNNHEEPANLLTLRDNEIHLHLDDMTSAAAAADELRKLAARPVCSVKLEVNAIQSTGSHSYSGSSSGGLTFVSANRTLSPPSSSSSSSSSRSKSSKASTVGGDLDLEQRNNLMATVHVNDPILNT